MVVGNSNFCHNNILAFSVDNLPICMHNSFNPTMNDELASYGEPAAVQPQCRFVVWWLLLLFWLIGRVVLGLICMTSADTMFSYRHPCLTLPGPGVLRHCHVKKIYVSEQRFYNSASDWVQHGRQLISSHIRKSLLTNSGILTWINLTIQAAGTRTLFM